MKKNILKFLATCSVLTGIASVGFADPCPKISFLLIDFIFAILDAKSHTTGVRNFSYKDIRYNIRDENRQKVFNSVSHKSLPLVNFIKAVGLENPTRVQCFYELKEGERDNLGEIYITYIPPSPPVENVNSDISIIDALYSPIDGK